MGIAQNIGSMEGKEMRIGAAGTATWSQTTTVTSNGSVNGMHDSTMPLTGMFTMLNMMINCWFGGVGVGFMNYYTFLIIAVFISGLMVGRTPEFLGKKVEAREMKIASIVALCHPFIILVGTAIAAYLYAHAPGFVESEGGWLEHPHSMVSAKCCTNILHLLPITDPDSRAWAIILISGILPVVWY